MSQLTLHPIGVVHAPHRPGPQPPGQVQEHLDDTAELEIFPEFAAGLQDTETFSHLHLFCWLDRSTNFDLLTLTPLDTVPHGVFATRSPRRPNPIGYWVVELLERRGNILKVKGLDAFDGTPIIDLKPYFPSEARPEASEGWATGKSRIR